MPARELADGALILIGGTLMLAPGFVTDAFGILMILPFTRPVFRRLLTGVVANRLVVLGPTGPSPGQHDAPVLTLTGRWSGARWSTSSGRRFGSGRALRFFALARCRWAGPISPPRSSSRRSLRMSSSSFSERRSSSMSQWVRTGFSALTSFSMPAVLSALLTAARALPHRRDVGLDRHGDLELVALRAAVADLLTSGELDAALVLETLASQPRPA